MNTQSAQPQVPHRGTLEFNAALRVRATAPMRERDYPHQQELPTWLGQRTLGPAHKCTIVNVVKLSKEFCREFGIDAPWHDITHPRCTAILADTFAYCQGKRRRIAANIRAERAGNVATRPIAAPKQPKVTRDGRPVCPECFCQIPVGLDECDQCSAELHSHTPSQGAHTADDYLLVDA